jgi:hypothetical protein
LASWPTPNAGPQNDTDTNWQKRREELKAKHMNGNGFGLTLGMAATLAAWATPTTRDHKDGACQEQLENDSGGERRESAANTITRGAVSGYWSDADWLPCIDGKARPVEPGTFPLAHGAPARVGRLRAYGNAIVAPLAEEFIRAYMTR